MILTLAAAAAISATCEWEAPRGMRRLVIPPASLVDTYTQVPADVRAKLKARIAKLQYDDVAEITRDSIKGAYAYSDLRWMYFGTGQRCDVITRKTWGPADIERALIFSETSGGVTYTLGLPTICSNLSLFTRNARINPPPRITPEPVFAIVDPVPVDATVTIPDVEPGPFSDLLPPQSFARLSDPDQPPDGSDFDLDQPSAEPWFYDLWARPIFGPVQSTVSTLPSGSTVPGAAVAPVPEPGTWALMLLGLGGVMWRTKRAGQ